MCNFLSECFCLEKWEARPSPQWEDGAGAGCSGALKLFHRPPVHSVSSCCVRICAEPAAGSWNTRPPWNSWQCGWGTTQCWVLWELWECRGGTLCTSWWDLGKTKWVLNAESRREGCSGRSTPLCLQGQQLPEFQSSPSSAFSRGSFSKLHL